MDRHAINNKYNQPLQGLAGKMFEYVIGIVGHPTTPDVAWSDAQLARLKDVGLNTLQMSIAWSWRPAGEVLNLEDLDEPRNVIEWQRRVAQARKFGFRTLAHFGLPMGPQSDATTCILDPLVRDAYAARLTRFFRDFEGVDDVMIYTYDQRAWLCSEFGDCPRCHGVPLHERLIPFLESMVDAVRSAKPGAHLWWEPWELSAGQTYAVVSGIRPGNLGLILHNSIAEVQFVNTTDLWFRNLSRLALEKNIPVIGEGFFGGSGEDIAPLTHLACPRLVYQQLDALRRTAGVVGVKEYYGFVPAHFSVNFAMLGACLRKPGASLASLLQALADSYNGIPGDILLEAWETASQAMELFPWDASWALRRIFETKGPVTYQSIPTASWATPAWQASRRACYLVTDEKQQHPWLREDVALRARLAAQHFARSVNLLRKAEQASSAHRAELHLQANELELASRVSRELAASLLAGLKSSAEAGPG